MRARNRAGMAGATAVIAACIAVFSAAPAYAHDSIQGTSPKEGAVVKTAPTEVVLEFSDDVLPIGAIIIVDDSSGTDQVAGGITVDGNTVTAPIGGELPDGVYDVRWRAVSSDGHLISDVFQFGVGATTTLPQVEDAAEATNGTEAEAEPAQPESSAPAQGVTVDDGVRTAFIAAMGAVAALGLVALGISLGRRRSPSDSTTSFSSTTKNDSKDS